MPSTSLMPRFVQPGFYPDSFSAAQTAMSFWADIFRTNSDFALWWTNKCIEAPLTYMALLLPPSPRAGAAPGAAIINLAEAEATRIAVEAADVAAAASRIVEPVSEVPVPVTTALEPKPDDLTRMTGIGPRLAAALAERGVTRFSQIARWTDEDLKEVDKALDLKGRAVREAWVAQAKRLSAEG